MKYTNYDVYAFQLLHFFVTKCGYTIVTIRQQKEDIWLMNVNNETYPVIRLSTNPDTEERVDINYLRNVHRAILDIMKREGKLCVLNTRTDSISIDNDFLIQIVISPNYISDRTLIYEFPGIEHVVHDVENNQEECAKLTSSLEEMQLKIKKQKAVPPMIKMPKITMSIIFICLLAYLATTAASYYFQSQVTGLIISGAYYKMNVVAAHEYWRFLTAGFLHIGIFHFIMNMYALLNIGLLCEKVYKKGQYIIILLSSIIVGNIFVYMMSGNIVSAGISGGIYGIMAAFIVCLFENGNIKHPMVRRSIVRLIIINAFITMMPGVSFAAHLGGAITGSFLGIIFISSERWEQLKKHTTVAFSVLILGLCLIAFPKQRVEPIKRNVDNEIIKAYHTLGLGSYADYLQSQYNKVYERE